jgi:exosortase D (VPLPA-CTERM-specific)
MHASNKLTGSWSRAVWALAAVILVALAIFYLEGARYLFREWSTPEYSHGMLIPLISLGIAWLKRTEVAAVANGGSWAGPILLALSLILATAGQLATIYLIVHIALVLTVIALSLSFLGVRATKALWFPLLFLFFMIPLPDFLQVQLSAKMQLLSSAFGTWLIRLFGITVFLDGNVIDLGDFKMQVVEACNGLRYMFPLMSFGMLVAYLYNAPFWQRAALFLSTIPITILMNAGRIGLIGLLYEFYGIDTASGMLHDFQGWAIFIVSLLLLLIEVRLLTFLLPRRRSMFDHFSLAARKA